MASEHLTDDGKRLFTAHAFVPLGRFALQGVEHIDVSGRIPSGQDTEKSGSDFAKKFCGK